MGVLDSCVICFCHDRPPVKPRRQYSHCVNPLRLLPELRGEWVRIAIGRRGIERRGKETRLRNGNPVLPFLDNHPIPLRVRQHVR